MPTCAGRAVAPLERHQAAKSRQSDAARRPAGCWTCRESDIADMAEASRRGRLLQSEPAKSLPDVPLHQRGFGVMDEDVP